VFPPPNGNKESLIRPRVSLCVLSAISVYVNNAELKFLLLELSISIFSKLEERAWSNEELNKQSMLLQQSEDELRNQAAELEQTNAY
jgi:hypothetical protein